MINFSARWKTSLPGEKLPLPGEKLLLPGENIFCRHPSLEKLLSQQLQMIVCHDCKPLNVNVKSTIKDCLLSSAAASNLIATVCVLSVISWLQRADVCWYLDYNFPDHILSMVPRHAGGAGFNMIATVSDLSLPLTLLLLHVDSYGNKHQEDGQYSNWLVWMFFLPLTSQSTWLLTMLTMSFSLCKISWIVAFRNYQHVNKNFYDLTFRYSSYFIVK